MVAKQLLGQSWSQDASREQVLVSLDASNELSPALEAMIDWIVGRVNGLMIRKWDIVDTIDISFASTKEETVQTGLSMADYLAQQKLKVTH